MSFREMAAKREEEAANLEEIEIYISIVTKFIDLEMDIDTKIEMMVQACGSESVLVDVLKECVNKELLTEDRVSEYLEKLSSSS